MRWPNALSPIAPAMQGTLADVVYVCTEGIAPERPVPHVFTHIWPELAAGVHVYAMSDGEEIDHAVFFNCEQ
jgi:hypothetical protein